MVRNSRLTLPGSLLLLVALAVPLRAQPTAHQPTDAQPTLGGPRPLAERLIEADQLGSRGDHTAALALLRRTLDSLHAGEGESTQLYYLLARERFALLQLQPALEAARHYQTIASPNDPHNAEVGYIAGVSGYETGEIDRAIADFSKVANSTGSGEENEQRRESARGWLARTLAERGRYDSAQTVLATLHSPDETALYLRGWIAEGRGANDTAALYYRRILTDFPRSGLVPDARLRLGVIEARRGQLDSARIALEAVEPVSPRQSEEKLFYLGEVAAAQGRYEAALDWEQQYLRRHPGGARIRLVRYGAGWSQLNLGRDDEAMASFQVLANDPDSLGAASLYQIAALKVRRSDTASAIASLRNLLDRLPYESYSDNANYLLGTIYYRRQMYDSARHFFLTASRQFPESEIRAGSYYMLGESYASLNDASNAQFAFARAQKTGAEGDMLRRSLLREGQMLYRIGRFRSAVARLRECAERFPNGPEADETQFWLAEALYQDRSWSEAERTYGAYVMRYPTSKRYDLAQYGLGWSLFQQAQFSKAAAVFEGFIKRNPNNELSLEATIRLADCYRLLKQYDKAIDTYNSIGGNRALGPRNEEARFRTAELMLETGEVDRAVEIFRKLILDYPSSPLRDAYAFNIGAIYHQHDRDSLAAIELTKFVAENPKSQLAPQGLFTLGDTWFNLEQFDSAVATYRRILDDYPNSSVVPDAMDAIRFALTEVGRGSEAIAIIDSFEVRHPNIVAADSLAFKRASIVMEDGDYENAIERFSRIVQDFPESPLAPDAIFQIARNHEYLSEFDSALATYAALTLRYPSTPAAHDALLERASLQGRIGTWVQADSAYREFLQRYPASERAAEARYGVAQARIALRDTAAATTWLRVAIDSGMASDSETVRTVVDRSRVLLAQLLPADSRDTALALLAVVVARRHDDIAAEALLWRGRLLAAAGDLAGAVAELKRLTSEFNTYAAYAEPGLLELGRTYERQGDAFTARETYRRLIALTTNPALKQEAQTRLTQIQ